jgi:hypothetical protein
MIYVLKKSLARILLCLLITFYLQTKPPLCISLGSMCFTAINLRELNLRQEAYPFDWLVTPFLSLYRVLEEDFALFFTDLKLRSDHGGVFDAYGIHFIHDFPTVHSSSENIENIDFIANSTIADGWQLLIPQVFEKYVRRIDRFIKVCRSNEKVIFLRADGKMSQDKNSYIGTTKQEALVLRDLLKRKFPNLNFTLVIFSRKKKYKKKPWSKDGIKIFYWPSKPTAEYMKKILKKIDPEFAYL